VGLAWSQKDTGSRLTVIEPRAGWRGLGLAEAWGARELLYYFVWRDLKVRYRQTLFGAAWAVIQPLLLMFVFSVSIGRISGLAPDGIPYPLFAFAGLVPWTLFSQSLAGASSSLIAGESVITKVYFPRLLLPFSSVGSFLLDFAIGLVVLAILMAWFGVGLSGRLIWLPLLTLMAVVTALGVGTFLAALNVRYRDVKYGVPLLVQFWMFASPVVYPGSLIPREFRALFALNPMTGVVEGFRWATIGGPPPDAFGLVSGIAATLIFFGALAYFQRAERTFADVI